MSAPRVGFVMTALLACKPAQSDRSRYVAVVTNPQVSVADGVAACAAIDDVDLAGDCGLHVAMVEASRPRGQPEAVCAEMGPGTWADECRFLAAESHRRHRRFQRAAQLCLDSGAFVNDCAQHLWQSSLHRIARGGTAGFATALPKVQTVYDRWQPLLGDATDFDDRFWTRFYQNGFERDVRIDMSRCADLPGDHVGRCEGAAVEMLGRELAPRLDRRSIDVCTVQPDQIDRTLTLVDAVPSDRLRAVLVARIAAQCPAP